ncbi:MAG: 2,3-bisphosphoglycerate-independent phosphoglycerate mutase [Candidatus Curtissbacteria bacterium]|nr:2,3-bisphosphoglycerate-independent phosphoglycerate mutase [Candidatus Curtissbacteria bacterium]
MLKITAKVKPLVLIILDGWGIAADTKGNAITAANPANFNSLWFSYPHTYIKTSGAQVGLPEGKVGNSEVGHQNLGAGKVVMQDVLRINIAISNGSFFENEGFLKAIEHANSNNSTIHLMGLLGPGSVHSYIDHFMAILSLLKSAQFPAQRIKIHVFTDGRDSPPTTAKNYLSQIIKKLEEENLGIIASVSGRYYAMDRDNRWDRTQKAYLCLTGTGEKRSQNALKVVEDSYLAGKTDEFIEPTVITNDQNEPLGAIKEGDSVIFFNFRPDRARQITKAFVQEEFKTVKTTSGSVVPTFERGQKKKNVFFATLTQYERSLPVSAVCFKPQEIFMPLARVFSQRDLRQLHIAETEKYAHVTYFFNGGKEVPFSGEDRILVDSPKVASYDLKPEMSAQKIAKIAIERVNSLVYDFIVVNFANADMVGHTGNMEATIKAVQAVDTYIGLITKVVLSKGGAVVITADHGNAEQMINPTTGQPDTEHNGNPAPIIIAVPELRGKPVQLRMGLMADVAPTILGILNIPKPSQMTGRNLLE